MRMKFLMMMAALLVAGTSFAQDQEDKKEGKREELETQKVAFITTKLDLTTEESQAFWPVYNEREKELKEVRKKIRENLKEGKNLDDMTDDEVKKMMEETLKLKQDEMDLEKKYNTKFQEVLPVKKVAKLYWAERKFNEEVLRVWKEKKEEGGKGKPHHKPGDR